MLPSRPKYLLPITLAAILLMRITINQNRLPAHDQKTPYQAIRNKKHGQRPGGVHLPLLLKIMERQYRIRKMPLPESLHKLRHKLRHALINQATYKEAILPESLHKLRHAPINQATYKEAILPESLHKLRHALINQATYKEAMDKLRHALINQATYKGAMDKEGIPNAVQVAIKAITIPVPQTGIRVHVLHIKAANVEAVLSRATMLHAAPIIRLPIVAVALPALPIRIPVDPPLL
jgi:hypothetical protein